MKNAGKKVTLASRYGNLDDVTMVADSKTGEVSYRAACNADRNCSGDYYVGLVIDRHGKRAYVDVDADSISR